ncbi:hypothetical protein X744_06020 [Mesorhizobium sp. LNJC372A00]|nr:hypothetical protein X745_06170 [Mesorhizobium sp. LNJC374B00]ESY61288.1 hypothetical protein X744_06020 [Mesorhizobium sp. LNJC372A00]
MSAGGASRRLTVHYATRPGFEDDPDSLKSPVIDLAVGFAPTFRKIRALIDTGADEILLDAGIVQTLTAPRTGAVASVKTVHGEETLYRH